MAPGPTRRYLQGDAEFEKLARGELASSTEVRLAELAAWGGFSSFMTPSALAAAADAEIEPIGQVIGLCGGAVMPGYVRTTRPGQGRARLGAARLREHTGLVTAWNAIRTRALARLSEQAARLGANAVVGITAERERAGEENLVEEGVTGHMTFAGTAVRVRTFKRADKPVLTLASAQQLWSMLRAGLAPAGIAGGFACVETMPSTATVVSSVGRPRSTPNVELDDLTESVYEVRRLAMQRLVADARSLRADGLLGVQLELDEAGHRRLPRLTLSVHVLAAAVRRTEPGAVGPRPVLSVADAGA